VADFSRNITGQKAVTDVIKVLGLTPPTSIADSTDRTAQQMWTLATEVGQQLLDEDDWQVLSKEFVITTVAGVTVYDLPADFNTFFNDASWNRTQRLPVLGSLSQGEWQMLKARNLGGTTFAMMYIITDNTVSFYSVGDGGQTVVIPYRSRAWVLSGDGATPRDNLIYNDDVILYDPQLFKSALKLSWEVAKKFDTTASVLEYNRVLAAAKAKDSPARTLSLARRAGYPYLGYINIPDTNYGL
jgi:hypothetical protein